MNAFLQDQHFPSQPICNSLNFQAFQTSSTASYTSTQQ